MCRNTNLVPASAPGRPCRRVAGARGASSAADRRATGRTPAAPARTFSNRTGAAPISARSCSNSRCVLPADSRGSGSTTSRGAYRCSPAIAGRPRRGDARDDRPASSSRLLVAFHDLVEVAGVERRGQRQDRLHVVRSTRRSRRRSPSGRYPSISFLNPVRGDRLFVAVSIEHDVVDVRPGSHVTGDNRIGPRAPACRPGLATTSVMIGGTAPRAAQFENPVRPVSGACRR